MGFLMVLTMDSAWFYSLWGKTWIFNYHVHFKLQSEQQQQCNYSISNQRNDNTFIKIGGVYIQLRISPNIVHQTINATFIVKLYVKWSSYLQSKVTILGTGIPQRNSETIERSQYWIIVFQKTLPFLPDQFRHISEIKFTYHLLVVNVFVVVNHIALVVNRICCSC
jgi:hypothetical protein